MKLTRIVKLQLKVSPNELKETVKLYTDSFNSVCAIGWADKDYNGVSLHHKTYYAAREYLPAQLAISSRMKATEALKSVKQKRKASCPFSSQCSVRYDANSYTIKFDYKEVSLLTVNGRKKYPITVPEYFNKYLSWRRRTADLFIRGNKVFLNIVFEKEIEAVPFNGHTVGIDRGINNIAVTSDNKFYSGTALKTVSNRYEIIKAKLQACGSKSAKRHLKRLAHKENRFRADVNHKISKTIIESLSPGTTIVLEDLKSIRQTTRLRKKQRKQVHKWNFYQLQEFLIYKGAEFGMDVVFVDSRYTSQKCSVCGYTSRSNRKTQGNFKCRECGFSLNADLNASRNIRQNHLKAISLSDRAAVNQPIVASVDLQELSGSLKRA